MSLTFIHNFQSHLHKYIQSNEEIMGLINNIYTSPVQDGKCPFLIVNIEKAKNLSKFNTFIYEIDFQILAYSKDNNKRLLSLLANKVVELFSDNNENFSKFDKYEISGIKANSLFFDKAKDLVVNKLTINYKALVTKEEIDELS